MFEVFLLDGDVEFPVGHCMVELILGHPIRPASHSIQLNESIVADGFIHFILMGEGVDLVPVPLKVFIFEYLRCINLLLHILPLQILLPQHLLSA